MYVSCPHCESSREYVIDCRTIVRFGSYYRTSDSKYVQRFRCLTCTRTFSTASRDPNFRQKKRLKNPQIFELLGSCVSQRRTARLLRVNRKTVARRKKLFGRRFYHQLILANADLRVTEMQFDELETIEHTKHKPVSILLAVEGQTRRILGFRVASMPAKGPLARKSLAKYGRRIDQRAERRRELFRELEPLLEDGAIIKSDSNPSYPRDIKKFFADCKHIALKGARGGTTGQGELKKIRRDPLFSLNHTCAMFRANVSALVRKTWCTAKKIECLADHLAIYAVYHNQHLKN